MKATRFLLGAAMAASIPALAAPPKVYRLAQGQPGDDANPLVAEAKRVAAKSLGDDARDLVFIPITPCTVWDTRFATDPNAAGVIANGATKRFFSHITGPGGTFATWGGNPSCPETAMDFIGARPFAVMMTVYTSDATANGWLTIYRDGDADPSLGTISVYYSPGPTRTQTVISKSSRGWGSGTYDIAATSRFGAVNASAAITGYFLKAIDANLNNVALTGNLTLAAASTPTAGSIMKGSVPFLHNYWIGTTFVGENAGNFTMTAPFNTAVGMNSMSSTVSGRDNTAVGAEAMQDNTDGNYNAAFGYRALRANTTGLNNTAVGNLSMSAGTASEYNTAVGQSSLMEITTGTQNVALGALSMFNATTSHNNTAVGFQTMLGNTSGVRNVAVGWSALQNGNGSDNIGIGYYGGRDLGSGSNNIAIGNLGVNGENTTLRIGSGLSRAFIAGIRGVTTATAAIPVLIGTDGQLGTASSSRAAKDDIADMGASSDALMKLRPVTFHYKDQGAGGTLQYGLIAEEVEQVYPQLVARTADGKTETVMYQHLPPMLLNEVQKQQRTIEAQARRIERLERALEQLLKP